MKITIAYKAPERHIARQIAERLSSTLGNCRIHDSGRPSGEYYHLYISAKRERTENEQRKTG